MKILVLSPFGGTEPYGVENLLKVARDDVELKGENIAEVFPLNYNTFRYNILKCADGAVERIITAEKEGYDAVVLSCQCEPGLLDAKAVVDIPVVGTLEASCHLASMMGKKFSLIAPDRVAGEFEVSLIREHGFIENLASMRWIDIVANKLYPEENPPEELRNRTIEVARKCIEEDGARALTVGCTILGAILTGTARDILEEQVEVPIIDPMVAGLKLAEMMVDLRQKANYPATSRIGYFKKQPAEEYEKLREWLKEHKSPIQYY
jgi:allantoin racemase